MTPSQLLRGIVAKAGPAELSLDDYRHLDAPVTALKTYLDHVLATKREGVNILIHGVPGTGKSQLTRVLAGVLDSDLFEVAVEDTDGVPIAGKSRLNALAAAQCFFSSRRALLVFDEMEDAFNHGAGRGRHGAPPCKGWINVMLETNRLPTFWLSNAIDELDQAFIRRFDMVLALNVPPKRQRERIIKSLCGPLLDAEAISRLAESEHLAPAVVARASRVASSISETLGRESAASTLELLVNQTLLAQGHATVRQSSAQGSSAIYDPAYANTDLDLAELAKGLQRAREGRLCLYGPPGTGKTAWGRWLADELGMPLHTRCASNLLGMYVGQSEKLVAEAFRQAREDGAVLMLDEVDSFLQDRRGALRSWETSLVNEMLTQMETFPGVFVASTNLMDNIDSAALRRFDLKLRFDYLQPTQALRLLLRHAEQLGLRTSGSDLESRLARLDGLTPGDFALVARRHAFQPLSDARAFVDALAAECRMKSPPKRPIGFT
jgi:SpoVK/Ycf46/Vps4 family AAA+-type ATPase